MASSDRVMALANELKKKKKNKNYEINTSTINVYDLANEIKSGNKNAVKEFNYDPTRRTSFVRQGDQEEEKAWYQKILQVPEVMKDNFDRFDDGWQFGDLTKTTLEGIGDTALTIGGTVADAGMGVVKGILNVGEGIGDAISYGGAQVLDWVGKDEKADDIRERASKDIFNEAFKKPESFVNKASILGETGDKVSEGIGYMASIWASGYVGGAAGAAVGTGTKAAQIGTTVGQSGLIFANSTGTNMADIYDQYGVDGVTDGEAWGKSLGSAAIETTTELMLGMFGKADAKIVNGMANRAKTALGSVIARAGGQAVGEGIEEVISYAGNYVWDRVVDAASKGEGAKFAQEWSWEDMWEQAGVAALTALAMGGGQTSMSALNNKTSTNTWGDAISETARQQNVSAQLETLEDQKAKLEKKLGQNLSQTEIDKTFAEMQQIDNQISELKNSIAPVNTTAPEDNTAQIEGLQNAIAEKTQELQNSQDVREQQIIQEEINNLQEELNEATNAQQFTSEEQLKQRYFTHEATDNEYKAAVYESAGKHFNDTKETHAYVEVVAKIAEDRGTKYEFVNAEEIKARGYDIANASVNGLVTEDGSVLINVDSKQGLDFILGHETTHLLEGTQEYQDLQALVIEYAKQKGIYEDRVAKLHSLYKGKGDINAELTSDLVGELLFTDQSFIETLSVQKPSVFKKIYDYIKHVYKMATAGSKEARQLEKIKRQFDKAYKAQGKQASTDTNTKFSVSATDNLGRPLTKAQQEFFKDSKVRDENGNLLTVYHGSKTAGFTVFNGSQGKGKYKFGNDNISFFTSSNSVADSYIPSSETSGKYEGYLNLKNPLIVDADGSYWNSIDYYGDGSLLVSTNEIVRDALGGGEYDSNGNWIKYDGVIIKNVIDVGGNLKSGYSYGDLMKLASDVYVAFNPNQFKNVDNTNPTTNPDIRYSLSEDNQGRKLSDNQKKYFKNSKVVDEQGRLKEVYHGTGTTIDEFKAEYTGKGNDQYGSGFYFTDNREDAEGYTTSINTNTSEKLGGNDNPNIVTSYLNITKPIVADGSNLSNSNIDITHEQTVEIIKKAPNLYDVDESPIGNWHDVWSEGVQDYMIDDVATHYEGDLLSLENDFFRENATEFRQAVYEATGYDGVIHTYKNGTTHYIAWFPNQIKSVNNANPTSENANIFKSLSAKDDIAPVGNVFGEDLKVQLEEVIAPLQEKIEVLTEQLDTVVNSMEEIQAPTTDIDSHEIIFLDEKLDSQRKGLPLDEISEEIEIGTIKAKNGEDLTLKSQEINLSYPGKKKFVRKITATDKNNNQAIISFWIDKQTVGYTEDFDSIKEPFIEILHLEGGGKGKGYGTTLVNQIINEAKEKGIKKIVAKDTSHWGAATYWEKQGFTPDGKKNHILDLSKQSIDDLAPTSQEIVEQQGQEAFETITDNEAPRSFEDIAAEAMWNEDFEYETENKVESPFDTRDIDEVGKRNIKAYQYENPEVRPYFQTEAQNMMYDLDNTIKGEKNFNDQLYYDTNGEQGWYGTTRQTTEAIAYLKDKYGYSYAQIEKGLNDIIEDNGKENNAVAKRIEFMLDERLRNGYTTSDGIPIPPNEEYIKFLEERQITEYNRETSSQLTDRDVPQTEQYEKIEPETLQSTTGQFELKIDESMPTQENTAQNQNTGLSDTSEEAQEQAKVAQILSEAPTKQNKDQRLWAKTRAAIFDKGSVVEDISLKTKNRELMSKWDYMLTAEARAQNVMMNGTYEYNASAKEKTQVSKSLNDIRTEVGAKEQEFSEYLYHKHNIDRMSIEANAQARMAELQETLLKDYDLEGIEKLSRKRQPTNIDKKNGSEQLELELKIKENLINSAKEYMRLSEAKNKPVFGDSVTAEISQNIVDEYEMNNPEFMDWAKDVYDYNKANLNQLVKSGVISQETADQFAEIYPHYVPIARANVNGNAINVPLETNRTGVNAPIARAKGGNQDILPLFDTMAKRTLQTYRATAKNNFGVELKNTLNSTTDNQQTSVDEILENVDQQESLLQEGKDGKAPTFTVFENGEKITYEITQDMYDALKPVSDSSILSTTFKPFNKLSNFHRGVLTEYNPVFMLTNGIKDFQDILLNSQHAAKTYVKLPEAYAQILSKGYWYQEYMANGGEQNSYFDSQEGTFDTERKGVSKVLDLPPLKQISQLNNFIEVAPRLAEYIASREAGRSIETSMLDAARVTTNFKAGGDVTKWANRNGATFLNASIQGAMQQVRNVREANAKGLKGYANLVAKFTLAGLPAILLNGLLWEDDDDYEELSDYVKQSYYIVGKYGDGQFIRIPKGRMITVVQEGLNQMTNLVTGNDEADLGQFLEIVGNNIAPNNPIQDNVLSPIIQAVNNKTWYGDDLVPTRLQDEPVEEQYDETTDSLSIFLGQKLGISPYKINYVLDQYSGGIGDVFLPMMTQEAETGSDSLLEELMSPLTNKFTVDSVMKNQNVSDLYTVSEELTSKANSTSATDEDILKNKYLNSIKSEMNELYKEKREIQNSSLSNSEKYAQTREIQDQINSMARNALDNYENVRISGDYARAGNNEYYKKNDTWTKVNDEELTDLNSLGMDLDDKNTYFNLKTEISSIKESTTENKKAAIATAIKDTSFTDEQKAYVYGKNYSSDETLDMVLNTGMSFNEYLNYASQEFVADKDSDGKSISGSRKKKVISYINSLNLNIPQKAMLIRKEYSTFDDYNEAIISYVIDLDLTYEEKKAILEEVEMKVSADGRISW